MTSFKPSPDFGILVEVWRESFARKIVEVLLQGKALVLVMIANKKIEFAVKCDRERGCDYSETWLNRSEKTSKLEKF